MGKQGRPLRTTRKVANLRERPGWYSIKAAAKVAGQPEVTQVSIYDEIGMLGVSADSLLRDLADVQGDIELHLNSPGGDVFDGIAIYNTLRARPGQVAVVVDGLAASAASFIAQAASPGCLAMAPHSQMMIHDGFGMAIGNASDMREMADLLDKASDNISRIYADRTGKPASYWRDKMRAETWLDDHEAVAEGLADHVVGQEQPRNSWDLSVYLKAPGVANADMHGDHERYDPDGDGDCDACAEGDTDHDYVLPDGSPGPKARGDGGDGGDHDYRMRERLRIWNEKYSAADRRDMAKSGEAMEDGSYPIRDAEDLDNAIHAVGRGGADHDAIRRHIIKRAKALGKSDSIPDNWNADGSISDLGTQDIWGQLATALEGSKE